MAGRFSTEELVFKLDPVNDQVLRPVEGKRSHAAFVADQESETVARAALVAITLKMFAVWAHGYLQWRSSQCASQKRKSHHRRASSLLPVRLQWSRIHGRFSFRRRRGFGFFIAFTWCGTACYGVFGVDD